MFFAEIHLNIESFIDMLRSQMLRYLGGIVKSRNFEFLEKNSHFQS